ncbi:mate-domain-containing protein [Boletus edulis]|nr:mate-domain-containing protein [Boletus edulis]
MSSSHSGGTSQSLQEDHPIVAHHAGASSVDVNGHQHTEILSDPPHGIPSRRLHELEDDVHDVASAEQIPTSKMFHEELRTLTLYSLPVFGTQLFEFSFVLATVISIGHISTVALAAATLASMTASVTGYSIVQGFASALDTLLPPAWTSDRPHMVGLWTQRMVLMTGMVLIPIIAIWFNAESILLALNQEPEVARLAAIYLRWASLGLPACTFNCISRRYFQSQGLFDIPTKITLVVAPINAIPQLAFCYSPLITSIVYPLGLSFRGAPFATALSFNLVSVASIFCGYYYASPTAWSPITRESFNPVTGELWKGWGLLARLGIAGVGQTASEWWSWELIGRDLGPVALASQFVLLISQATTYQAPFALGIATSVRIGNLLGEGRARRARIAAATSVVMAFGLACLISDPGTSYHSPCYAGKSDFDIDCLAEVVSLVASIFPLVALFQVFDGTAGIVSGIFRARGKQSVGALLNLSAYYVLGIPLGLYLTFVHGRGLAGLWEGLTAALVYCSVVGLWVGVYRVDWEAEVASAQARVGGKDVGDATDE